MADPIDQLQATLSKKSYSLTAPRKVIFKALQNKEPQTMRALIATCQNKTDRASIYRTIQLFEQLGIVQRLQIGWKYKLELSQDYAPHHHHLSCVACGKIVPFPEDKTLEKRLRKLAEAQGFQPQDHQLEIRGLCQNCQTETLN